ncbi:hypothetical protein FK873_gp175 [Micromonas pusilla virus SP1]|jgi:hypothetical protein|uniref:Uncharacterized protein n=1 Tax=Micromonas pusilla virus SP1 TaxID=373996 RepID=G9E6D6_MPSP1|nr:hypothetical protein FK873_gp175 [Micromonas pusilla virus SP1]AET84963.1 hypothetical protein MPXG_00165 [Micromonas pusilla virus SP1]
MLFQAIANTTVDMGPHYLTNICKWVKSAVWDAPYRVYLDVQLERQKLERNLSLQESDDESHTD